MPAHDPVHPPAPRYPPPLRPEPTDGGASETEGWWPARPGPEERFNSPRRWAGRLAFPLLVAAVLLAWHGLKVAGGEPSALPPWAWWTLAGLSAIAGLVLLRTRHRSQLAISPPGGGFER